MIVIYYCLSFLCTILCRLSVKRYSANANDLFSLCIYSGMTGLIAMVVFAVSAGFRLSFNRTTWVYAFILALIVLCSLSLSLLILRFMGISESGIISSSGTLLLTSLAGFLFFRETVSAAGIVRILLMLLATTSVLFSRKKNSSSRGKVTATGLILCCVSILMGTGYTILNKLFAIDPNVTDSNSWFFLTNLILVIAVCLILLIVSKGNLRRCLQEFRHISGSQYLMILTNTVSSNISSLLAVLILEQVSVSLHSPLSSALGILADGILAFWVFREKPRLLPIILALLAVSLGIFQ